MKAKQYITIILLLSSLTLFAESPSKLDSLLNLNFNSAYYPRVLAEIKKYDTHKANELDSAVQYLYALPKDWPMSRPYKDNMNFLTYRRLPGYALLVEQAHNLYLRIGKEYMYYPPHEPIKTLKPVIYLYPENVQQTDVTLNFNGSGLYTYPKIDAGNSWHVKASPTGMLKDEKGNSYPYLFWEGVQADMSYIDFTEGFVVAVAQLETFLEDKLTLLGLNARERTDFITYWAPKQQEHKYVFIRFETDAYSKAVPLTINPAPQSAQRIFTVFMPVEEKYTCRPQALQPFTRKGYTVIEWGGVQMPGVVD